MNLTALAIEFGSYYSMVGAAQTRAIVAAAAIALVLGAIQLLIGRIRGRKG